MKRREFMSLLGGAVAAAPLPAYAQTSPVRPLIGLLSPTSAETGARLYRPLRTGLRELGYAEGRNVTLEMRFADGDLARLPARAAELVALKPDVIVAGSTPGTLAAFGATRTIPIVMITLLDPVALGVVQSIARPGGNVTGIWTFGGADALIGKRIGLLKEIVPDLSRMAVIIASGDQVGEITQRLLPAAARALGVSTKVYHAGSTAEIDAVFAQAASDGMQAGFIDQSPFFLTRRTEVATVAARTRLPAIYGYREHAESGGLLSYGSSLADGYRQAVRLVDKILKGAKPSELPVEQADKYELVVNNKAAKALGLKISEAFLLRADEVIE